MIHCTSAGVADRSRMSAGIARLSTVLSTTSTSRLAHRTSRIHQRRGCPEAVASYGVLVMSNTVRVGSYSVQVACRMFAMTRSVWSRERPAAAPRETLSRGQIVQAALEKLNAGATSLYWHVQTKDDLLELVADEVYSEIDVPEAELAGWRSAVTLFGH